MYVITTDTYPGYWGVGDSEAEAIANCKKNHGKAPFLSYRINNMYGKSWVNGMGTIVAELKPEYTDLIGRQEFPEVVEEVVLIGARGKRTPVPAKHPSTGKEN
jgi:hypothetical protein